MRRKTFKKQAFTTLANCTLNNPGKRWAEIFQEAQPLVVELGCGRGDFTLGLAERYPNQNYLGIDAKPDRLWAAGVQAQERQLKNAHFLRENINHLTEIFIPNEVATFWITFPDPYPKNKHSDRRLTAPYFLAQYQKILAPGGWVHLKTDNRPLFEYTLGVLAQQNISPVHVSFDIHNNLPHPNPDLDILTFYERRFMAEGIPICYLAFQF